MTPAAADGAVAAERGYGQSSEVPRTKRPRPIVPIAYRIPEAAAALGMSIDHFDRHVRPTLRVVRSGQLTLFPVKELEKWVERQAQMELGLPVPGDR